MHLCARMQPHHTWDSYVLWLFRVKCASTSLWTSSLTFLHLQVTLPDYHFPWLCILWLSQNSPSSLESTHFLTDHMFHLHGIPTDLVSDRGPQFILLVWKQFCSVTGATNRLTAQKVSQELESAFSCMVQFNLECTPGWTEFTIPWCPLLPASPH